MASVLVTEVAHSPWPAMLRNRSTSGSSYRAPPSSHHDRPQSSSTTSTPQKSSSSHTPQTANVTDNNSSAPPLAPLAQRTRSPSSPRLQPADAPAQDSQGTKPDTPNTANALAPQSSPSAHSVRSAAGSIALSPNRIKIKSLQHIQSFVNDENNVLSRPAQNGLATPPPQYEISEMPVTEIIEMVAGLLTKITSTNDRHHDELHRPTPTSDNAAAYSAQTSSVLAFHGKNVPSITILSYLSRIHKYCPTTYEVFISLLVYFDRMTEVVNYGPMQILRQAHSQVPGNASPRSNSSAQTAFADSSGIATPRQASGSAMASANTSQQSTPRHSMVHEPSSPHTESPAPPNLAHFFVLDSFNIHRLVIAGVTCGSKFFSDVFYTNSRYAKVCFQV